MRKKSIRNQVGWIGLGNLINAIVNILLVPYLARALSLDLYGTYGQVLMLLGIANVFFGFGLSNIVYQELNDEANTAKGVSNIFYASFVLGLLGSVLLLLFADPISLFFDNENLAALIRIYAFSLLFILISELFKSILTHYYKTDKIAKAAIIHNFLRVGIIFCSIHYLGSVQLLFVGLLSLEILNAVFLFSKIPHRNLTAKIDGAQIRTNIIKGLPLALSGAVLIILTQTDGVMISALLGTEEYAVYRMGAIPVPLLSIVFASIIRVTISEVNKMYSLNKIKEIINLKVRASSATAFLTYPSLIFMIVFAEPFINFYLGEKYVASISVFMIYNLILFLRINDFRDILIASSNTRYILTIDLTILLFNGILNYILIVQMGILGAAIASICSYFISTLLLQYRTSRLLGIPYFAFFKIKKLLSMLLICFPLAILSLYLFKLEIYNSLIAIVLLGMIHLLLSYWILLKLKVLDVETIQIYMDKISFLRPLANFLNQLK